MSTLIAVKAHKTTWLVYTKRINPLVEKAKVDPLYSQTKGKNHTNTIIFTIITI